MSPSDIIRVLTTIRPGVRIEDALTSERINALQDGVRYLMEGRNIEVGLGLRKARTLGKVKLRLGIQSGRSGSGDARVWNNSATFGRSGPSIRFTDGLVNNVIHSNAGEPIRLNNGKNYLFAMASATGASIQTVKMEVDNGLAKGRLLAAKETPPAEIPILIALAVVDAETKLIEVTRLRYKNVVCTPVETLRESRRPPSPGEEPFIRYYAWKVEDEP